MAETLDFRMDRLPSVGELEVLWRGLETADGSLFTRWSWIGCWLKTLPGGLDPQLITAERAGRPIAAAIAYRRQSRRHRIVKTRQLHLNATGDPQLDCITIEHNDFAGASGLLADFVDWFDRGVPDCDEICIPGVSAHPLPARGRLLRSVDAKPAFKIENLAAIANGGVGAILSRNARQQLASSFRKYESFGALAIEEAATPDAALRYFDELKTLHSRSWTRRGRPHAFRYPYFEEFHRALIASAHGAAQMLKITAGPNVIGYLYNFRHNGKVYAYQSGFADEDPELRPGYICHAMAIERNAREGVTEYDFLAGDNRLKRSFGKTEYAVGWYKFARPSPLLRLEAAAGRIRSALKS